MAFDKLRASLKNAFDYAVHGESSANFKRKPEVADAIVAAQTAPDAGYAERLRDVLMQVKTADLDTLKDAKISIVLDQRLAKQDLGFRDYAIYAAFYKRADGNTVSLQDSGKTKRETGYFDTTSLNDANALSKLAQYIRDGGLNGREETLYASRYSYATRGAAVTFMEWRLQDRFDAKTVAKNPALKSPPAL